MPYISQHDREMLMLGWALPKPKTAGELNYVVTLLIHEYLENNGNNYQAMNDILGALDGCSKEFYRRKVAPYEDIKIEQNGDV